MRGGMRWRRRGMEDLERESRVQSISCSLITSMQNGIREASWNLRLESQSLKAGWWKCALMRLFWTNGCWNWCMSEIWVYRHSVWLFRGLLGHRDVSLRDCPSRKLLFLISQMSKTQNAPNQDLFHSNAIFIAVKFKYSFKFHSMAYWRTSKKELFWWTRHT